MERLLIYLLCYPYSGHSTSPSFHWHECNHTSSNGNILNSPHKGQWRGAFMFSLICAWIKRWVTNREAGDLRRHRAHCDVIVTVWFLQWQWNQLDLYGYNTMLPNHNTQKQNSNYVQFVYNNIFKTICLTLIPQFSFSFNSSQRLSNKITRGNIVGSAETTWETSNCLAEWADDYGPRSRMTSKETPLQWNLIRNRV